MKIEEKLALCAIKPQETSHIQLDAEACLRCENRVCLLVCPGQLYTLDDSGRVRVEHSGCLECGTCLLLCPLQAVRWSYPEPGFGIRYRLG